MCKAGARNDTRSDDGNDRELLIRYLEYVLVDVAAINPASARLIELAIEHLHPSDASTIEARTMIN
jgi:hypothetical protein